MKDSDKLDSSITPFYQFQSSIFASFIVDKLNTKFLADIDTDSASLLISNKSKCVFIFNKKEVINFLGITLDDNNKRSMKKILEISFKNNSYFDNTNNGIQIEDVNNAIKSWLEK